MDYILKKILTFTPTMPFDRILNVSKANSGGDEDYNFLKSLYDNKLINHTEGILKRSVNNLDEEYFIKKYTKQTFESINHYLCRTIIQEELHNLDINTFSSVEMGNLNILSSNANYDIVTENYDVLIDIGFTPARNYFKGLTDLRVQYYMMVNFFDDYDDDIIFSIFTRADDNKFLDSVKLYTDSKTNKISNTINTPSEEHYKY